MEQGWRFTWAPGSSFIAVRSAEALSDSVPYDMAAVPEWINVSRIDRDAFETLCLRWLRNTSPVSATA